MTFWTLPTIWTCTYLVPETSPSKWLFQLDDSKPLLGKWLLHQTSIRKWLFRVPGIYCQSSVFPVSILSFRTFRWVEVETWSHHVQFVGVYFVNLSLGPQKPETLGGGFFWQFFVAASEEMRFGRCRDQDEVFFLNYPPGNGHILPFFQNTSESMIFRNPRLVGYEVPLGVKNGRII